MDLKDHLRAVASHSLDLFTEGELDKATRDLKKYLRLAKQGKTEALLEDIRNTAAIFRGLEAVQRIDRSKAYLALRRFVGFVLSECPHMRAELTVMLAPCFDLNTTLH